MKTDRALPPLMMVDDDQDDAVIFARRLKDAGVPNPLLHFRNGGDAFMFLKQFCVGEKPPESRPCLMFLDVNMPNLSGFDVLAWARLQPALRGMKIIMLSGATEPWDSKIAAKLGADGYLTKFPDPMKLKKVIAVHLPVEPAATLAVNPSAPSNHAAT
ncbi:response regulator [Opitutus sp. ER46]|uniref:response regulator n=1 Tax=Opitutus sp. ER46 TaxID=2161864 RepID=UPI0013048587|nr:response regulator [Opitutus sp. ER46]